MKVSYSFSAICMFLVAVGSCLAVEEQALLNFYNSLGMQPLLPAKSCNEIYTYNFASRGKSGYYWIKISTSTIKVYCDMQLSCGGKEGGWMKIASIVNGDSCPTGWMQITSPVKACRSTKDSAGCYSATYTNNGISYQHVCGKVVGYQKGTPDGFYTSSKSIDSSYVDGVSLTYGTPRKHLWTYANGVSSNGGTHKSNNCPCARYPGTIPPTFVRDHYYCDSGNPGNLVHAKYYTSNAVWDGEGCTGGDSCCSQAGMPWFYRQIPTKINESIEARICYDQSFADEGILVGDMELFVQ